MFLFPSHDYWLSLQRNAQHVYFIKQLILESGILLIRNSLMHFRCTIITTTTTKLYCWIKIIKYLFFTLTYHYQNNPHYKGSTLQSHKTEERNSFGKEKSAANVTLLVNTVLCMYRYMTSLYLCIVCMYVCVYVCMYIL